ncbi:MAG: heat-inducible transcription repressor HrcA [Chloroflexi bacterium]|nr:heat-inducible transcription repressor HrcA [Chloroflexota bacterium]
MLSQGIQTPRQEPDLTPRQQEILKAVVQEYVASATPVGSSTVRRAGGLEVSSATIRNELAVLEELGYVVQPHTSAGRCPTVKGYRYFVERLMEDAELPLPEQRLIRHQFHQIRLNLDQWMRLTAAVLARIARSASLVTPPRAANARFRRIELISINEALCLMVLVLQDSSIHQEMLLVDQPMDQGDLTRISNILNAILANQSAAEIRACAHPDLRELGEWGGHVLERLVEIMEQRDQRSIREVYRDGLVNVLSQPEFEDADKFRQVIEVIEHPSLLESILAKILNANGVQIIIGGEGQYEEIDDVSLVLSPYGLRGIASGVLGIMGPTRMSYAHAISTVRYVARVMDDLIADVYGSGEIGFL